MRTKEGCRPGVGGIQDQLPDHHDGASNSPPSLKSPQVLDCDGHPLPERTPGPVYGAPRRSIPGWVKWACDRWLSP
jgi:hypothetical protein